MTTRYKWIGRSMDVESAGMSDADIAAMFDRCEASIEPLPAPPRVRKERKR